MATEIQEIITDDLTGTKGAEHVSFSFMGTDYEIDLGARNRKAFNAIFADLIPHARRVGAHSRPATRTTARRTAESRRGRTEIRTWAKANGHLVAEHGRIPTQVVTAYEDHLKAQRGSSNGQGQQVPQVVLSGTL